MFPMPSVGVSQYHGWQWKADASSDEVVGHTIAFTVCKFGSITQGGPYGSACRPCCSSARCSFPCAEHVPVHDE